MELLFGIIIGIALGSVFGNLMTTNYNLQKKVELMERKERIEKHKKERDFLDRVC